MKILKKIMLCFMSFTIAISCMTGIPLVRASADTNYYTAWIRENLAGKAAVDTGGEAGTQCVELCTYFARHCLGLNATSSYGNGNTYYSGIVNAFPNDFTKIPYYDGMTLQPGDIVSFESGYHPQYGHAAVVYTVSGNTYTIVEQSTQSGTIKVSSHTIQKHVYGQNYTIIGVARPNKQPAALGRGYDYYGYIIRTDNWKHMTYHSDGVLTAEDILDDPGQVWFFGRHATEADTTVIYMPEASGDKYFGYNSPESGSGLKVGGWNTNWLITGESGAYSFIPTGAKSLALTLDDNGIYTLQPFTGSKYQLFQIWNVTSADIGTMPETYYSSIPTSPLYYNSSSIMKGSGVTWLQRCLNNLGYSCDIDGSFGSGTKTAVQNFQSANGLTADGSCGDATRNKIISMLAPTGYSMAASSSVIASGRTATVTATPSDNRNILNYSFTYITPNGSKHTYIRGTDNVFSFYPNDGAGTYQVYCDLYNDCGVYSGSAAPTYVQVVNDVSAAEVSVIPDYGCTGSAITPEPTVILAGKTLKKDVDYTLGYNGNIKAGTASVIISGIGRFTGSKTVNFNIVSNITVPNQYYDKEQYYTGEQISLTWDSTAENVLDHYWVDITGPDGNSYISLDNRKSNSYSFSANEPGTYQVVVWAVDIYDNRSTSTKSLEVVGDISRAEVSEIPDYRCTGSAISPEPAITFAGKTLQKDVDYTLAYDNNIKAGTASVMISGIGRFTGSQTVYFNICTTIKMPYQHYDKEQYYTGELISFNWDSSPDDDLFNYYWVTVYDPNGQDYTYANTQKNNYFSFTANEPGEYKVHVWSLDIYLNSLLDIKKLDIAEAQSVTPTAPENVKAVYNSGKVTISWDSSVGASKYRVRRNSGSGWTTLATVGSTTYVDTAPESGTNKYVIIPFVDGGFRTDLQSEIAEVLVGAETPVLNVTAQENNVTVTWNAVSGATKYRIRRNDGTGWTTLQTSAKTSYVDTAALSGKRYTYVVYPYINGSFGTPSDTVKVALVGTSGSAAVTAVKTDDKAVISWGRMSGVKKYRVRRNDGTKWQTMASTANLSWTDSSIESGKTYTYVVYISTDGTNYSKPSSTITLRT